MDLFRLYLPPVPSREDILRDAARSSQAPTRPLDEDEDDGAARRFDRSPSEALRFVGRR
jgi:hypothetical protein